MNSVYVTNRGVNRAAPYTNDLRISCATFVKIFFPMDVTTRYFTSIGHSINYLPSQAPLLTHQSLRLCSQSALQTHNLANYQSRLDFA